MKYSAAASRRSTKSRNPVFKELDAKMQSLKQSYSLDINHNIRVC